MQSSTCSLLFHSMLTTSCCLIRLVALACPFFVFSQVNFHRHGYTLIFFFSVTFEMEKSFIIPTTLLFDEQAMNNTNPFSFSGHSSNMNFNLNGNHYVTNFFRHSNQKVNLWFIFWLY